MCFDYGGKRTGIAVSDPLGIIASPLQTVETKNLLNFVEDYCKKEEVDKFVIGKSLHKDGTENKIMKFIYQFKTKLEKKFKTIPIFWQDEFGTSTMAKQAMLLGGLKKKARRDKAMVDKVSATLILQAYMQKL